MKSLLRIALVHDWVVTTGGAERVLAAILENYPTATFYYVIGNRTLVSTLCGASPSYQSWLGHFPLALRLYKSFLPLMPLAVEDFDLSEYDLVLSDCSAVSKGVLTRPDAVHVSYIHSPMRYVWDLYQEYRHESSKLTRMFMSPLFSYLRMWDRLASERPDVLIANSTAVQRRIAKHYRRESTVVHPPVDVDRFSVSEAPGDYYIIWSRLVSYKRFDLAIQACNRLKRPLIVAGEGPELRRLKAMAGPTIKFVGRQSDEDIAQLVGNARALLFPGEEDFGIVPVEAQAAGRPVVAYGRGGVLDSVIPGQSGILFEEQTVEATIDAMEQCERMDWDPQRIRANAERFRPERFRQEYQAIVNQALRDAGKL